MMVKIVLQQFARLVSWRLSIDLCLFGLGSKVQEGALPQDEKRRRPGTVPSRSIIDPRTTVYNSGSLCREHSHTMSKPRFHLLVDLTQGRR